MISVRTVQYILTCLQDKFSQLSSQLCSTSFNLTWFNWTDNLHVKIYDQLWNYIDKDKGIICMILIKTKYDSPVAKFIKLHLLEFSWWHTQKQNDIKRTHEKKLTSAADFHEAVIPFRASVPLIFCDNKINYLNRTKNFPMDLHLRGQ